MCVEGGACALREAPPVALAPSNRRHWRVDQLQYHATPKNFASRRRSVARDRSQLRLSDRYSILIRGQAVLECWALRVAEIYSMRME